MEAKDRYLEARHQSSYKKKKNRQDWFSLWLDYLQLREKKKKQTFFNELRKQGYDRTANNNGTY